MVSIGLVRIGAVYCVVIVRYGADLRCAARLGEVRRELLLYGSDYVVSAGCLVWFVAVVWCGLVRMVQGVALWFDLVLLVAI